MKPIKKCIHIANRLLINLNRDVLPVILEYLTIDCILADMIEIEIEYLPETYRMLYEILELKIVSFYRYIFGTNNLAYVYISTIKIPPGTKVTLTKENCIIGEHSMDFESIIKQFFYIELKWPICHLLCLFIMVRNST